jgi:long-chain acyl-CoA synthetase
VNAAIHSLVAGPILASHPLDLQYFPSQTKDKFSIVAPVGPPSINIEAKLVGVDDISVESGGDPVGVLNIRGPPVGRLLGMSNISEDGEGEWLSTGLKAKVLPNGTFKIAQ